MIEENWYCFKCKEKMVMDQVWLSYLEVIQPILGLRCLNCKTEYLTEDTVVNRVNKAEEMLEDK